MYVIVYGFSDSWGLSIFCLVAAILGFPSPVVFRSRDCARNDVYLFALFARVRQRLALRQMRFCGPSLLAS
jgi:hypothetical protein